MSSFLVSLLIPVLVASAWGIFKPKQVWMWSWATWISDLDFLGWTLQTAFGWPNVHRALLHNGWILVVLAFFGARSWKKWRSANGADLSAWVQARPGWILVPFYYGSHIFLDVFAGGIALWWPLTPRTLFWDFAIVVNTEQPVPVPTVESETGTVSTIPNVSQDYLWMSGEEFAIFLIYLVGLVMAWLYWKRTASSTEPVEPFDS